MSFASFDDTHAETIGEGALGRPIVHLDRIAGMVKQVKVGDILIPGFADLLQGRGDIGSRRIFVIGKVNADAVFTEFEGSRRIVAAAKSASERGRHGRHVYVESSTRISVANYFAFEMVGPEKSILIGIIVVCYDLKKVFV
jgi:hypothetical protein